MLIMKNMWLLLIMVTGAMTPGSEPPRPQESNPTVSGTFAVFSDPHYYDPSLGTEGKAFQAYLDRDRKLLRESRELIIEAINMVNKSQAEFVIVPGDLTKDGTLVSHSAFAQLMQRIEETGREVYVVPGNHDVSNGESFAFRGDTIERVENVSPADFEEIYADFGYDEALYRDSNSLSYVVEPSTNLWLLGLDACLYRENEPDGHPVTDGRFLDETLSWIDSIHAYAMEQDKQLMAFMHHGVLEHYDGQERFFGEYVVDNYKKVSKKFAKLGIHVVFTGHYHAQDITMKQWNETEFVVDVETGSLVTWPCPVRFVEIDQDSMFIESQFITSIPSFNSDFEAYSKQYVYDGIAGIAEETMVDMKLKREEAAKLSGQIADAFIAHYGGDEIHENQKLDLEGVGLMGRLIIQFRKKLIKGLYKDIPPADNAVAISLTDGGTGKQLR